MEPYFLNNLPSYFSVSLQVGFLSNFRFKVRLMKQIDSLAFNFVENNSFNMEDDAFFQGGNNNC